jgi:hypothetical protein
MYSEGVLYYKKGVLVLSKEGTYCREQKGKAFFMKGELGVNSNCLKY